MKAIEAMSKGLHLYKRPDQAMMEILMRSAGLCELLPTTITDSALKTLISCGDHKQLRYSTDARVICAMIRRYRFVTDECHAMSLPGFDPMSGKPRGARALHMMFSISGLYAFRESPHAFARDVVRMYEISTGETITESVAFVRLLSNMAERHLRQTVFKLKDSFEPAFYDGMQTDYVALRKWITSLSQSDSAAREFLCCVRSCAISQAV